MCWAGDPFNWEACLTRGFQRRHSELDSIYEDSMTDNNFNQFIGKFLDNLKTGPLDPEKPEHDRLYCALPRGDYDPIERLYDTIDLTGKTQTVQIVYGFRGTGKTTEYARLKTKLQNEGYVVVHIDLDSYLHMFSPIDISEFLLIIEGAIAERLALQGDLPQYANDDRSYWKRAKAFLKQEGKLEDITLNTLFLTSKISFGSSKEVKDKIRMALHDKLPKFVDFIREFHNDLINGIEKKYGAKKDLVVILDSLEHIRGTVDNYEAIHKSIEELFVTNAPHIKLPKTHLIISIPAFLHLFYPNLDSEYQMGATQVWPVCPILDEKGKTDQKIIDGLIELIEKRGDWKRIFRDKSELTDLVKASGGYIKDLFNLLTEALFFARRGYSDEIVDRACYEVKCAYQPIYADDRDVLKKIAASPDLSLLTRAQHIKYVARFLDSHTILCYKKNHFVVHPLVLESI